VLPNLRTTLTAVAILGVLLVYFPLHLLRFDDQVHGALRPLLPYSGVVLFITGFALSFSGTYYLIRRGGGTPLLCRETDRLVVAGPYSYLQHPILLGILVILFGEALWLRSPSVGIYAVVLAILSHCYVVYIEEPQLTQRFGIDYRSYRRAVPRWLPQLTESRKEEL
jgi:protein-S-isoprenylcysteine O-methyltransferase Ste14